MEADKDFESLLNAGARRFRMPANFKEALRTWKDIKCIIGNEFLESKEITAIDNGFGKASWAWRAEGIVVEFSEIDRLGESLCGPPYTCVGYEWPISPFGYPYLPLVQLDLRKAGEICGVNIGDGFLQLFETSDSYDPYFLRTIPRSCISAQKMLSIPEWTSSQLAALEQSECFVNTGQLEDDCQCIQVSAYSKKAFSFPRGMFWSYIGCLDGESFGLQDSELIRFNKKVQELSDSLDGLDESYGFGTATHLFGSFRSIQYSPEDCSIPLFCIDGSPVEVDSCGWELISRFELGCDGNGQVFIEAAADGSVDFTFDWSCY